MATGLKVIFATSSRNKVAWAWAWAWEGEVSIAATDGPRGPPIVAIILVATGGREDYFEACGHLGRPTVIICTRILARICFFGDGLKMLPGGS